VTISSIASVSSVALARRRAYGVPVEAPTPPRVAFSWEETLEIGRARNDALYRAEGTPGEAERGYALTPAQVSASVRMAVADATARVLARRAEGGRA
jgi:hypothetical protein